RAWTRPPSPPPPTRSPRPWWPAWPRVGRSSGPRRSSLRSSRSCATSHEACGVGSAPADMPADPVTPPSLVVGVVRSLRPKQWAKNVLVFAAPVAAGMIDDRSTFLHTLAAFACFCAAASATYLLNDAVDVEADRRHPVKRHRPI